MNEKYLICEDGFENVVENGQVTGFNILIRIPYYRGIYLSLIDDIELKIDGELVPRANLRLTTSSGYAFTLSEMETVTRYRWEYGEKAKLTVVQDGGLKPGKHQVDIKVVLRISYMPKGSFSRAVSDLVMPA
jgi:hypothetical protein